MKYLPILLILLFSCQVVKFGDEQYGRKVINSDTVIYHVNIYGDTTLINYKDARIVKNDTLIQFYESNGNTNK